MCRGVRAGRAAGIATFMVGIGFGVLAGRAIGIPAAVVMSFVVYAGSAQLAALGVLAAGGSIAAAAIAGLLMNARFIPMGIAAASAYRGGRLRRAVEAQTLVDASWAMASNGSGHFDRQVLIGATVPQAIGWWAGTALGAFAGTAIGNTRALGLDAIFPAFFLALLVDQLRSRRACMAALLAAAIAVMLIPDTPAGVPVAASAAATLLGLLPPRNQATSPLLSR
jgi:4-azaleucine resistance transporter AzlC